MHQHATLEDTVYFWFAANDTSGSEADGATPVYDVRLAGAAADAIPTLSGAATLLSHANYPKGCHEIAIAATAGNTFADGNTYAVFCTLLVDGQNPAGFAGSFTLGPIVANLVRIDGAKTDGTPAAASRPILYLQQLNASCNLAEGAIHLVNSHGSGYGVYADANDAACLSGTDTGLLLAGTVDLKLDGSGTIAGNLSGSVGTLGGLAAASAAKLDDILDGTGGTGLTLNKLTINGSAAGGVVDIDNAGGPGVAIDGSTDGMSIVGAGGDGLTLTGSDDGVTIAGAAGRGLDISGYTYGVYVGASTEPAMKLSTSTGNAIEIASGGGNGDGISITANGTGVDINLEGSGTIDGDITGNLSGSVGSVTTKTGYALANGSIANATFATDVYSTAYATNRLALAVRKVLDELNLDHLAKTACADATMAAEVVDATILSYLMANGDTSAFTASTDGLQPIRDQLSAVGNAGSGAWTVTVTVDDGSDALESASVRLTKGAATYVLQTDADGEATFNLDSGTYTVAISLVGYTYAGTTVAVSADATPTYSMTELSITSPSDVTLCTVQFVVKLSNTAVSGAVCKAKLQGINQAADGTILSNEESSATTDANGEAELELVRKDAIAKGSGIYKIWVEIAGQPVASAETKIPNQTTISFEDLL